MHSEFWNPWNRTYSPWVPGAGLDHLSAMLSVSVIFQHVDSGLSSTDTPVLVLLLIKLLCSPFRTSHVTEYKGAEHAQGTHILSALYSVCRQRPEGNVQVLLHRPSYSLEEE